MFAWSGQCHVSDQEDKSEVSEVVVCHRQKTGWRQNEFQSKRREVQSEERRG